MYSYYSKTVNYGCYFGYETGYLPNGNHFIKLWKAKDAKTYKTYAGDFSKYQSLLEKQWN